MGWAPESLYEAAKEAYQGFATQTPAADGTGDAEATTEEEAA